MATDLNELQNRLWGVADELRANSGLRPSEYSAPVLGLIFLRYAEDRFAKVSEEIGPGSPRLPVGPNAYLAKGALYLVDEARFGHLVTLPEGADLGKAINDAMKAIEEHNPDLAGVLPRDYGAIDDSVLAELLRTLWSVPDSIEGDGFGLIYEYFLGQFAFSEGQRGGEFFTPTSIVRLIVEILEPNHGRIYDPAAGSGGMFVQSAKFVERHQARPSDELVMFGQEKVGETVRLGRMNLAVHGLEGSIVEANTYYEDIHDSVGKFDFVMANPPFNVNKIDKAKLEDDPRFPYGLPNSDNGNYLWIQIFASALSDTGRAGFVMANSAGDAGYSERDIRQKLIESKTVDVMVAIGTNFFYTVALPVTLWFLDKGKTGTDREDNVLFIDARKLFRQIDKAHRDFLPEQIELLANIVRLYRGEGIETVDGSDELIANNFPDGTYVDVPGLCKIATIDEIETQGWSLNPGRYTGTAAIEDDGIDFRENLEELYEEFSKLSNEADRLRSLVDAAVTGILDS